MQEFDIIVDEYKKGNISLSKASKKLGISRYKLRKKLVDLNIKINSYYKNTYHKFDDTFFEEINNEYKAYWLGFICADGHVSGKQLTITLNYKDHNHLRNFLNDINSQTHTIDSYYHKTKYGVSKVSKVCISSVRLCKSLRDLGLESNKTYSLEMPKIEKQYIPHFIRGYFDGDGSISLSGGKYKKPYVVFLGNNNMMKSIKQNLDISKVISILNRNDKKQIKHFRIGSKKDVQYMYNYFYENSTRYLKRKKDKFDKFLGASETIIAQPN